MLNPQEKLRLLARDDAAFIQREIVIGKGPKEGETPDRKTRAIARLAALIALDAPDAAYGHAVREAIEAGSAQGELIALLIALAPSVGVPRMVAAAPKIAAALGYNIDEAFEA